MVAHASPPAQSRHAVARSFSGCERARLVGRLHGAGVRSRDASGLLNAEMHLGALLSKRCVTFMVQLCAAATPAGLLSNTTHWFGGRCSLKAADSSDCEMVSVPSSDVTRAAKKCCRSSRASTSCKVFTQYGLSWFARGGGTPRDRLLSTVR